MISKDRIKINKIFNDAMIPNSLRILLLVKMKVENPDAVVRFVKRVALPILEITRTKDFA